MFSAVLPTADIRPSATCISTSPGSRRVVSSARQGMSKPYALPGQCLHAARSARSDKSTQWSRSTECAELLEHQVGERQSRRAKQHEATKMRAAKRRKVADAGGGEDDRCDDAEQRIASLDARGEDGDAENGPRNRRHVKERADDGAGAAGFSEAPRGGGGKRAGDILRRASRKARRRGRGGGGRCRG